MIHTRVEQLRQWMKLHGLHAYIFPSTDPHSGEYVPDHWKARQWISGFDGSAGTAVVTLTDAALWTDSRYFLAAEEQLRDTPFQLMKQGIEGTPTIAKWLAMQSSLWEDIDELNSSNQEHDDYDDLPYSFDAWDDEDEYAYCIGIDGWCNTLKFETELAGELNPLGMELITTLCPFDKEEDARQTPLWPDRPALPLAPIEVQPLSFAGESVSSKIERVRAALRKEHCDATIVSKLDELAWLLNLRGTDVHCNPIFVSYVLLTEDECTLYVDKKKLTPKVRKHLKDEAVGVRPYEALTEDLKTLSDVNPPESFLIEPATISIRLFHALCDNLFEYRYGDSVIAPMKAVKNDTEMAGYRSAMRKDGIAMVKFLRWLQPAVEAAARGEGEPVTEMSADRKLTALRAEQPHYRDISFDTIAGYGPHGAIVHYEATPETDVPLQPRGFLLLDSGAQYQDGTTDITRTIALGSLTDEERHDYTLVLRGHIRLAMAKFPSGTTGTQLDVCARYAMWQEGTNYLHGTGHGVGSYLCVHEGPHQFRMSHMPAPLLANMTVTVEPGIYRAGKYGVRTENTMLISHFKDSEFGEFLQLEPLTLCPIDTTPIILSEMQADELAYLNWYHHYVYEQLSPYLDEEDRKWLEEKTKPLTN